MTEHIMPADIAAASSSGVSARDDVNSLALVRGFSRVFWGLALAAALILSQTALEVFDSWRVPAYVFALLLECWGLLTLRSAGPVSPRWKWRLNLALALAFLGIYFFPFAGWWSDMPYVIYYTVNLGVLAAVAMGSLIISNIIAADYFASISRRADVIEARICAGTVAGLMAAPLLAGAIYSAVCAERYQTSFVDEFIEAFRSVPLWLCVVCTVPYSLTLAVLWKARDRSYRQFCLATKKDDKVSPV